jgi:hypothetical protein
MAAPATTAWRQPRPPPEWRGAKIRLRNFCWRPGRPKRAQTRLIPIGRLLITGDIDVTLTFLIGTHLRNPSAPKPGAVDGGEAARGLADRARRWQSFNE